MVALPLQAPQTQKRFSGGDFNRKPKYSIWVLQNDKVSDSYYRDGLHLVLGLSEAIIKDILVVLRISKTALAVANLELEIAEHYQQQLLDQFHVPSEIKKSN